MAMVVERPRVDMLERLYTAADLAAMPSELPSGTVRYELDNGRLISMAPPGGEHCATELRIGAALMYEGEYRGFGKAWCGEVGILLWSNPDRVVGADAAFASNALLPIQYTPQGYLATIPELVVEVVSKNDSAPYTARKVEDYLRAGVQIVWVADPQRWTVTVHRCGQPPQVLGPGEVLTVEELIPGFALPVEKALAR
jgi:Uma2 family endonuclease